MSVVDGPGPAPVLPPGFAPLGEGHAEAARFAALVSAAEVSDALARLRLTQLRALQLRFRNDMEGVCSLAAFHGSRTGGIAGEAGFRAVQRRTMALAALYDELLCNAGAVSVGFASYLGRLCAWLTLAELPPGRALILLAQESVAAGRMDADSAAALGAAMAELVAAAARWGGGDVILDMLAPDGRGQGRLTVTTSTGPGREAGLRPCTDPSPGSSSGNSPGNSPGNSVGYGLGRRRLEHGQEDGLALAGALAAQVGGKLDRIVSCHGAGWCISFQR